MTVAVARAGEASGETLGGAPGAARGAVACRTIAEADEAAVAALLARGFGAQDGHWVAAMAALRARRVPPSCPRYGFCLTADGDIVGVLLLIFSDHGSSRPGEGGDGGLRCNVSSWFVEPDYRFYAPLLLKTAYRRVGCTYLNSSSESHTRPGLIAQGYACYAAGQVMALPALGPRRPGAVVTRVRRGSDAPGLGDAARRLLVDHAERGCIALACSVGGRTHPFVFLKRRLPRVGLPCAQLVFCEDLSSFVDLHGVVGRFLLRAGVALVMFDASGPVAGIAGRYLPGRMPKYFFGPTPPRLGDLAYGEDVLFGLGRGH